MAGRSLARRVRGRIMRSVARGTLSCIDRSGRRNRQLEPPSFCRSDKITQTPRCFAEAARRTASAMLTCPHCRKRVLRVRRTPFEKLLNSDVYACSGCRRRIGARRSSLVFLFSRYARCIECGSSSTIARLAKPDRVDRFSGSWLSRAPRFFGAPLYRCSPCRVQFYDWRQVRPDAPPAAQPAAPHS
jgi:DNA-directed RNA polymerase subunit RPC12/RpoP